MKPGPDEPVVQLTHVSKEFANHTVALSDISLAVEPGEFVTFLGPSGCGKSTILRLVSGLSQPTSGDVSVFGRDPLTARKTNDISFVFQDASLMPWASVAKNIALPLTLRRAPRAVVKEKVDRVISMVGLDGHADDLPRQLSGGMRMRVSIARALITQPRLLLMDEPFAALDEITRQALQAEVLEIWRRLGTTVLFITHNVFEAAYLSSRVVVMKAKPGEVVAEHHLDRDVHEADPNSRDRPEFAATVAELTRQLHPQQAARTSGAVHV